MAHTISPNDAYNIADKSSVTVFSDQQIGIVRQIIGFEGIHEDDTANDVLIVGIGYDHPLMSRIANDKDGAKLIQLLSLPSLSADMYQESILCLEKSGAAFAQPPDDQVFFAPANDPFVIAHELSLKYKELNMRQHKISNLYLCPLATKVQALGFALFYMTELKDAPASILFPFARSYDKETSTGMGRSWIYEIVL